MYIDKLILEKTLRSMRTGMTKLRDEYKSQDDGWQYTELGRIHRVKLRKLMKLFQSTRTMLALVNYIDENEINMD